MRDTERKRLLPILVMVGLLVLAVGPGDGYRGVLDGELAGRPSAIGAVLIEGPKGCVKTAIQKSASTYRLDVDPAARNAARVAPDLLLDSPSPVLFDEWQVVPTLWDQVRRAVDDRAPAKALYS